MVIVTVDSIPGKGYIVNHHEFYITRYPNPFIDCFSFYIYNSSNEKLISQFMM